MNNKKSFFDPEKVSNVFFILILGIFIGICILMIWPFIKVIGAAIVLAIISYPSYSFILKRIKNAILSALLASFIIIVCILLPTIFLTIGAIKQAIVLSKSIQVYIEKEQYKELQNILNVRIVKMIRKYTSEYLPAPDVDLQKILQGSITQIGSFLGKQTFGIVKNILIFIIQAGLSFVIFFFLLIDGKKILPVVKQFLPLSEDEIDTILSRAAETIRVTVYGWLIIGIIQGTLLGIIFAILGLPSPLLFGGITVLLCFIPLAGAPIIWVPAAIILIIQGFWWKAIILVLYGGIVINLTDNFLRPILVGTKLKLHPLIVFFAIFGGLILMGPLGLILGPVVLAVLLALLEMLRIKLYKPVEEIIEQPVEQTQNSDT